MFARYLLGLPSGIGPTGTPIDFNSSTTFIKALVDENPSNKSEAKSNGSGTSLDALLFFATKITIFNIFNNSSTQDLHSLKSEIKLNGNPVSENTLILIFKRMKLKKENYKESVEYLWNEIPEIDQNKLDRPEKFTLETFIKDMKMEDEKMWNLQKEIDEIEAKKKKLVEEIRQCEKRKQQVQLNMKQKFKDSEKRLGRL